MAADNISTRNVWPNYDSSNIKLATAKGKENTLDKDDFLRILVTQLKNQDPMQPLQDRDFIAQMAQFSSVEQLMNMAGDMTKLRQNLGMASSMIGKDVDWYGVTETGETIIKYGTVDGIVIRDGKQYAKVGDTEVALEDIVAISVGGEPASE
ncbi:hypothetical protein PAECIP111893_01007 [Paenibacillus plantiphilus]|uniref:Flagellar hook capping protein n=1 Tax=Paenibacillus plantiphilus TaxID=2905650 RepID=A0ABM9BYL6_9BACL|nr:flagellar hook capping FlgD N-terminal domain-containing protein [Paenibacillus plantiphilus]CAH1197846.1 hypothetical protein PAECIP111893_01007 [Paenibacillus plantiphilus]